MPQTHSGAPNVIVPTAPGGEILQQLPGTYLGVSFRENSPSATTQGAPTLAEQTRFRLLIPPPQQASLPVKLLPPSRPLQPDPARAKQS